MKAFVCRHGVSRFIPKSQFLICVLLLSPAFSAHAQTDQNLDIGLKPYGSYHGGELDSVNMVNGNLTLHIPIASYPQRGDKLKADYYLVYNDKNWQVQTFANVQGPYQQWSFQRAVGLR